MWRRRRRIVRGAMSRCLATSFDSYQSVNGRISLRDTSIAVTISSPPRERAAGMQRPFAKYPMTPARCRRLRSSAYEQVKDVQRAKSCLRCSSHRAASPGHHRLCLGRMKPDAPFSAIAGRSCATVAFSAAACCVVEAGRRSPAPRTRSMAVLRRLREIQWTPDRHAFFAGHRPVAPGRPRTAAASPGCRRSASARGGRPGRQYPVHPAPSSSPSSGADAQPSQRRQKRRQYTHLRHPAEPRHVAAPTP